MSYYQKKQFIAQVDKNDRIIGRIEKWETHRKGTLHRGFTAILIYKNQYLIQHRKHPVFDKVYDLSFSSHPIYLVNDRLQDNNQAVLTALKREWNLEKEDLKSEPQFLKKIYYKAEDPNSDYTEHEIDYIYEVELHKLPSPNYDFCYGYKLVNKLEIGNLKLEINLAPWVKTMIEEKIIK